ncbi:MAG: glycosyltransferase family 39 protein [Chloroflexi bacterium]|nr:glycosyltransferase family 39 protein [Chloroflexota bacterium]
MRIAVTGRTSERSVALATLRARSKLELAVGAIAVAYILIFLGSAIARATYPFPLDPIEPGALQQVRRVLAGQPLYVEPKLDYVPFIYGPVYFYLAALFGPTFAGLRLVSILASCASMLLLARLVERETHSWLLGLVSAAVLAAANPLVHGALDLGRMDALALALMLAAIFVARVGTTARAALAAGVLVALAILTKQTAAPLALALVVALLPGRPRHAVLLAATTCIVVAAVFGALTLQSGRWPLFYFWELPRQHVISVDLLDRFWDDLLARATVPLLVAAAFLLVRRNVFYALATAAMLGSAWVARANSGGAPNVDLPAFAMLALLFGLGLPVFFRHHAYIYGLAAAQLLLMLSNPRQLVPYRADVWAGERLSAGLQALPGPVFAPSFGGYIESSGADPGALGELMGAYGGRLTPEGQQWLQAYGAALAARQYARVVVDPDWPAFFIPDVARDQHYTLVGPLFPSGDEFWSWRGSRTPRADVYAPP